MIPNDFKNAIAAINFGEPVVLRAPKSEISTSLMESGRRIDGKARARAASVASRMRNAKLNVL